MRAANENHQTKPIEEEKKSHLELVKVLVPRDKVVEIRSMAMSLLKESFYQTRPQEKALKNIRSFMRRGIQKSLKALRK